MYVGLGEVYRVNLFSMGGDSACLAANQSFLQARLEPAGILLWPEHAAGVRPSRLDSLVCLDSGHLGI